MRKALLATTALAFSGAMAAGQASAADMLSIGLGGYMEQWVGAADRQDDNDEGGVDIQSDSEIYFQGSMEADNGLKFTVHVQLEANQDSNKAAQIDESFARISGDFGQIEIGARDPIHARTHYGIADVGVGLNSGDTQKWIPGTYLSTNGWFHDNLNVIYISPRMNGVQVGLSYGADATSENSVASAPKDNDNAVVAAGINLNQTVGDAGVKISLGHLNREQAGDLDAKAFTNAGLAVSMGAFGFNAAWAEMDGGDDTMESDDWTAWGASVSYSDGPMSVSLGHMTHEQDSGGERTATMLSGSYKLAPGVSWATSVFTVEDNTTGVKTDTGDAEGAAFVTGVKIGF
ncbi:MAG: porin [Alphaproteobacteria bacterium]|nr:porin [Alphaproteobacteria bacterium]